MSHTLLVNADDLGLHPDIDRGILQCVDAGRVQSVSFSPNGKCVDWRLLQKLIAQGTRVGLHVTLVGEPWITDGRVVAGWKDLVRELMVRPGVMRTAVAAEVRRQFEVCAENGLEPRRLSHVDSHQHVHVFGGVWEPVLAGAREHGIARVRVPWCPSISLIKKNLGGVALQTLAKRRTREVPDFLPCLGLTAAGHNTVEIFRRELKAAAGRDCELVVHPGVNTGELESRYGFWHFDWTTERDALLSERFASAVSDAGFELARPLTGSARGS